MICTTIREGHDCQFMTAKGCSYSGGSCHEVISNCDGCSRTAQFSSKWYCSACPEPATKWKRGNCNLATHVTTVAVEKQAKINPLKASKRAHKKK